jgi:hypothetical protein
MVNPIPPGKASFLSLESAINGLKDTIMLGDKAQKASLALGMSFRETHDKLAGSMDSLRGGFTDRLQAGMLGLEAGLQGNFEGVSKLTNQQQLTGTEFRNTSKVMAHLQASLGLSNDAVSTLAESFIETGDKWQVSTATLVQAVNSLKDSFPVMRLAGLENLTGVVAELTGKFGGEKNRAAVEGFLKMLVDTSDKTLGHLAAMGLGGIRERISGQDVLTQTRMLEEAIVIAGTSVEDFSKGAKKNAFHLLDSTKSIYGKGGLFAVTLMANMGKREKDANEKSASFWLTIETLRKEAFLPLTEAFIRWHEPLVKTFEVISGFANKFSQALVDWFKSKFPSETIDANIKMVTIELVKGAIKISNFFTDFFYGVQAQIKFFWPIIKEGLVMIGKFLWKTAEILGDVTKSLNSALVPLKWVTGYYWVESIAGWFNDKEDAKRKAEEAFKNSFEGRLEAAKEGKKGFLAIAKENNKISIILQELLDTYTDETGIAGRTARATESIDGKTPDKSTPPAFLDTTADMLGSSIERILGVGRNTTQEEMLEQLTLLNGKETELVLPDGAIPTDSGG